MLNGHKLVFNGKLECLIFLLTWYFKYWILSRFSKIIVSNSSGLKLVNCGLEIKI